MPHVAEELGAFFANGVYVTATIKENITEVNGPLLVTIPVKTIIDNRL